MEGLIGSLLSSGASLINGSLNRSAQAAANDANAQQSFNYATNAIDWKAGDAVNAEKDFGINRLIGMGVNPSSGPIAMQPNTDNSISNAGQDIGRAMSAYADKNDKAAQLSNELTKAKIDQTNAVTAGQVQENLSRRFASPGSPPGLAKNPEKPAYTKYDNWPYSLLSHDAAST